jgi:hypothetical protein
MKMWRSTSDAGDATGRTTSPASFSKPILDASRRRSDRPLGLVIMFIASFALMSSAAPQNISGSGPEIVRFQFAIKLPTTIDAISWFPDNKTLLVKSDGLRLVDIDARSISKPVITATLPSGPKLLVSPDGAYLAVLRGGLRIFSTTDWQPLTDWQRMPPAGTEARGRQFPLLHGGLQFTPDSRFVWVACEPRAQSGETAIAIKFRVPDLQVIDTIESKIPGASFSSTTITENSDDVIEHGYFYTDKRDPQQPTRRWYRAVGAATNLGDKSVVMAPKDLRPDVADGFIVHNDAVSADHRIYVLDRAARFPGLEPDDAPEPKIISYDTHTLQRIMEFGFQKDRIGDSPVSWSGLSNLLLLKGTDLAIAARATSNHFGGFRVWNVRTGKLVQSLPAYGVLYLAVSPDQKRIAMQFEDELQVYSINTAEVGKL